MCSLIAERIRNRTDMSADSCFRFGKRKKGEGGKRDSQGPGLKFRDMRQLKFHEKKLLKKVDFLKWKSEDNIRELQVILSSCCKERHSHVHAPVLGHCKRSPTGNSWCHP